LHKLHIQTLGSGKPIVLIHGWGMHSGIWLDFAQQLAAQHQVILVDLPGHGHSPALTPFSLDNIIDSLAAALPDMPCCWLGWSLGATVAMAFARRYPARASALILLAGNPCFLQQADWPGIRPVVLESFADKLQADAHGTLLRFLSIQVMALPNAKSLGKALKTAVLACPAPSTETLQGGLAILKDSDLRADLAAINAPILVLLGKNDSLIPAALQAPLKQLLPAADIQVLEQAAHTPFLSHPAELLTAINAFMDQHRC
jgi:pimeloyl-[acyl-carrier protein] methyl ester esterase